MPLEPEQILQIAREIQCDPRTVRSYVNGQKRTIAPIARLIDEAIFRLGFAKEIQAKRAG